MYHTARARAQSIEPTAGTRTALSGAASEAARLAHLKAHAEQRERCRTADGARSFVPGRSVLPHAPFTGVASDPAAHLKGIPRRVPPRPASRVVFRSSRSLDILAKSPGMVEVTESDSPGGTDEMVRDLAAIRPVIS